MTVAELIAKLLTFDGGMDVYVSANGDLYPISAQDVGVKHGDVVAYVGD